MGRIYAAINTQNNKTYIGKESGTLYSRRYQHLYASRNGSQTAFHRAIRKYGEASFIWLILEEYIPDDLLDAREKRFIEYFQSFGANGYNLTRGGEGANIYTEDQLIGISTLYISPVDWIKHDKKTYLAAVKKGILDKCYTHQHKLYSEWTYDKILKEARKYTCVSQWSKSSRKSYDAAIYHNLFQKCIQHMSPLRRQPYTEEEVREMASHVNFRCELSSSVRHAARRYGILNELFPILKERKTNKYGKIKCITTGEIFESAICAARAKNLDLSSLCKHLKGKVASVKGLTFERYNYP